MYIFIYKKRIMAHTVKVFCKRRTSVLKVTDYSLSNNDRQHLSDIFQQLVEAMAN